MKIDIRTTFPQVAQALRQAEDDLASKVLARTLNVVVAQASTQMGREIRSQYNLPADYVRQRLRVRRAYAKGGQFTLQAELAASDGKGRSANVIRFVENSVSLREAKRRAKQGTLRKLFVQIKRQGGKKAIDGAFIGNKGRTVFIRTGESRLPIKAVRTIAVGQMFNARRINDRVLATINERFPVVFAREMRYALSRLK
jgi:hypothetical protein